MKFQGKLSEWNDAKGYGFVEPNGGGTRAFVHIKAFTQPSRRPVNGDLLIYEPVQQSGGKHVATKICLASERHRQVSKQGKPRFVFGHLVGGLFCVMLLQLTLTHTLPVQVISYYFCASLLCYLLYAHDKSAATHQRWRTPEKHLHILALIGGWPGALYAQNRLRHKSSKIEFRRQFWLTVFLNLGGFFWLLSEQGQHWLKTSLG